MRFTELFTKTTKTAPKDERAKNAQLLIKAGFVAKASAGVYSFLPLGLRVLEKINAIIRKEMNALGSQELLMPALVDKKYWEKTERWDTDVVYKTGAAAASMKHAGEFEYGLGWTHEEVIASIATNFIGSYRDLPKAVYQIQTKFRAEVRAQGGVLRGREFLMKDLYSFHADTADLNTFYEQTKQAYHNVFHRVGLTAICTEASGGAFTKEYTHEFQVESDAGEDTVYHCETCGFCQNREVYDAARHKECAGEIKEKRSIEVGNIFKLGTRFSEAFGLLYRDQGGAKHPVVMGSYGIGPTRTLGTIVEVMSDDRGMVWPQSVAPFSAHLVSLGRGDDVYRNADEFYRALRERGIEVLYDDRTDASAGEKLADTDLMGIPYRFVVSEKTGDNVEVKQRTEKEPRLMDISAAIETLNPKP